MTTDQLEPGELSYEAALAELEGLIARMEAGQLPLDELLSSHRRGAELLAYCKTQLAAVEQQVQLFEGGELSPWSAT
jgi:exodeoxyribonuclease VII small subunit